MSVYTDFVDVPSGVALLCDPLFFGPSGITFSEPVTMVFAANPDSLQLPSDMRMVTFKVRKFYPHPPSLPCMLHKAHVKATANLIAPLRRS